MVFINSLSDVGMASSQTEEFITDELFTGDMAVHHTSHLVSAAIAAAGLAAFSVVGLNGSGELVMAQTSGTAVVPIGITAAPVVAGATDRSVPVIRTGIINPAMLNWHADYDTDAKKIAAFESSSVPANTKIILRKIRN